VDALQPADVQEAISVLKSHYVKPDALSDAELARATLLGVLERIGPGASLIPAAAGVSSATEPSPFYVEILDGRVGYLRLGDLSRNNLGELDAALRQQLKDAGIKTAILDLRATPASSDFELAAEVIKRFCAKGKPLFTLKKAAGKGDRMFTSNMDPAFQGLLIVLLDESTSGAPEAIASVLRAQAGALLVGEKTTGQAFEFSDVPLRGNSNGVVLRVAVAEVALPDGGSMPREGVKPDIAVEMPDAMEREVMRLSREKGVAATVAETERAHMNEAALVAGKNPELDALQAAQRLRAAGAERPKPPAIDVQLQRALDLVTTVSLFETKRAQK